MYNANAPEFMNKILTNIIANLENTKHAPSVQMNDVPQDAEDLGDEEEDSPMAIDTKGGSQQARDERVVPDNEFYDEEDKDAGERYIGPSESSKVEKETPAAEPEHGAATTESNAQNSTEAKPETEKAQITEEEQKEIDELNKAAQL